MNEINRLSFTYKDYHNLLDNLIDSNYVFSFFEKDNNNRNVVFMRHDIDKSIDKAFEIASIEEQKNVVSSFFFLTRSPLYSILEPHSIRLIREIHSMGHSIGLHIDIARIKKTLVNSNADLNNIINNEFKIMYKVLDGVFEKIFSFHNPTKDLFQIKSFKNDYICTYDENFMLPKTKYISDSNSFWREGDPIENIKNKKWKRLQILTHPIWWTQDNPVNIIKLLNDTISGRSKELDSYLISSNSAYAKSREAN